MHRNKLPKNNIFEELINDYSVKISSVILRKKILVKSGLFKFDNNYNNIGDFDLNLKIASKYAFENLNIVLINFSNRDRINRTERLLRSCTQPLNKFKKLTQKNLEKIVKEY